MKLFPGPLSPLGAEDIPTGTQANKLNRGPGAAMGFLWGDAYRVS